VQDAYLKEAHTRAAQLYQAVTLPLSRLEGSNARYEQLRPKEVRLGSYRLGH
jgi:hypothetical protein